MSSLFSGPYYSSQALWELLFVSAAVVAEDGQVKVLIGFEREYSTGLFWETTYTSSRRHSIVSYIFKVSFLLFPAVVFPAVKVGFHQLREGVLEVTLPLERQTLSLWAEGYV